MSHSPSFLSLCFPGTTSASESPVHRREIHPTNSFQALTYRNKKQTNKNCNHYSLEEHTILKRLNLDFLETLANFL